MHGIDILRFIRWAAWAAGERPIYVQKEHPEFTPVEEAEHTLFLERWLEAGGDCVELRRRCNYAALMLWQYTTLDVLRGLNAPTWEVPLHCTPFAPMALSIRWVLSTLGHLLSNRGPSSVPAGVPSPHFPNNGTMEPYPGLPPGGIRHGGRIWSFRGWATQEGYAKDLDKLLSRLKRLISDKGTIGDALLGGASGFLGGMTLPTVEQMLTIKLVEGHLVDALLRADEGGGGSVKMRQVCGTLYSMAEAFGPMVNERGFGDPDDEVDDFLRDVPGHVTPPPADSSAPTPLRDLLVVMWIRHFMGLE